MKKLFTLIISVLLTLVVAGDAVSEGTPAPTALRGGKVISTEEAGTLFEEKAALFFDVRNSINYGRGHIPNAYSLPYKGEMEKSIDFDPPRTSIDTSLLPADKDEIIVFYSHGPTGWKSYMAAIIAIKTGHKNVLWFRGGYSDWEWKGLPVERGGQKGH